MATTLHQAGTIPYRIAGGDLEVLLITSRDTGRWIIPKGNIDTGLRPIQAAMRESYEEAGVIGTIMGSIPLGFYNYFKRLPSGAARAATVEVYLFRVKDQAKKWPEKKERQSAWVSIATAAGRVEEPGLVSLFWRLAEFEEDLAAVKRGRLPRFDLLGPPEQSVSSRRARAIRETYATIG